MAFKRWVLSEYDSDTANEIAQKHDLDAVAALLLSARGITDDAEIEALLNETSALIDPFCLPDMELAVERIQDALERGEKIAVFGDFDADGVTSTALLYSYLEAQGANAIFYIPDRSTEGYGLNNDAISRLHEQQVNLIITVDNGISAISEVAYANSLGMQVIITDHHMQADALPAAVAIVNPHRKDSACKYDAWAGVGVAFKLVCALEGDDEPILDAYADLVTIGTIADIVSVLGENRTLIRHGLRAINKGERVGIHALRGVAGVLERSLTSGDIAFVLAPRINAAGRMGSAERAVRLLITEDPEEAVLLAEEIAQANTARIEVENEMFENAYQTLLNDPETDLNRVLVVSGEGWHPGVSGIVASRLVERFGKPCIVIAVPEWEETAKGSCRSIKGFSIFDALVACSDLLTQFGGHTLAAGLSLKAAHIPQLSKAINRYAAETHQDMPVAELKLDFRIKPSIIDLDMLASLQQFQPHGMENAKPVFGLFKMEVLHITPVSGNKHIRITLHKAGTTLHAMYFNHSTEDVEFRQGDLVNAAVTLERNEYYGKISVSVFIKEIRLASVQDDEIVDGLRTYERFLRQESLGGAELGLSRDQIALVYKFIRSQQGWRFSPEALYARLRQHDISYAQVRIALDVLTELGLLLEEQSQGRFDLPVDTARANLEDSALLQRLQQKGR